MIVPCFDNAMASDDLLPDVDIPVTDDMFLGETLSILQPSQGYRAGIDAVLLAATVNAAVDQDIKVLDLGAGVGVVGLAVAARLPKARVVLLESQRRLLDLASMNVSRNDLAGRITVQAKDITQGGSEGVSPNEFDFALANPPFYEASRARLPPNDIKANAHVMPQGSLDAWFRLMAHALKPGGVMTVIHRAEALPDLLQFAAGRFGALEIQPILPFADQPANRVILRGRKGTRKPLSLLPGLVIHRSDRTYQPEINQVLRSPTGLKLADL